MDLTTSGAFRLFRAFGIDVYLHWTWFLMAWLVIGWGGEASESPAMKAAVYVTLVGIVLLHEFGHALACLSVGGRAERIVLWPLGGIAYVEPPARPGPYLWSIVAGPLVNLLLLPVLAGLWLYARSAGWQDSAPELTAYLGAVAALNGAMLVFNLLPVYPLDGGQILHAVLWYGVGRWQSLQIASLVGVGVGACCLFATPLLGLAGILPALLFAFILYRSVLSFQYARAAEHVESLPRHADCACPACDSPPPQGPYWVCDHCHRRFDLFDARGQCPDCGAWYLHPDCPRCRERTHIDRWFAPPGRPVAEDRP